jgi:acyl carrier protein
MDSETEILEALTEILRDTLGDDSFVVTLETSAKDHAEWDSFNNINLIVATEVRFNVKFRTTEIDSLKNVGDFVALIKQKLQKAA